MAQVNKRTASIYQIAYDAARTFYLFTLKKEQSYTTIWLLSIFFSVSRQTTGSPGKQVHFYAWIPKCVLCCRKSELVQYKTRTGICKSTSTTTNNNKDNHNNNICPTPSLQSKSSRVLKLVRDVGPDLLNTRLCKRV